LNRASNHLLAVKLIQKTLRKWLNKRRVAEVPMPQIRNAKSESHASKPANILALNL